MTTRPFVLALLSLSLLSCGRRLPAPSIEAQSASAPAAVGADSNSLSEAQVAALCADLTQAVRRYAAEQRRVPTGFGDLVTSGYLSQVPPAPAGKQFVINKSLQVSLGNR